MDWFFLQHCHIGRSHFDADCVVIAVHLFFSSPTTLQQGQTVLSDWATGFWKRKKHENWIIIRQKEQDINTFLALKSNQLHDFTGMYLRGAYLSCAHLGSRKPIERYIFQSVKSTFSWPNSWPFCEFILLHCPQLSNTKFSQQRFWNFLESGLLKTIPMIPHMGIQW